MWCWEPNFSPLQYVLLTAEPSPQALNFWFLLKCFSITFCSCFPPFPTPARSLHFPTHLTSCCLSQNKKDRKQSKTKKKRKEKKKKKHKNPTKKKKKKQNQTKKPWTLLCVVTSPVLRAWPVCGWYKQWHSIGENGLSLSQQLSIAKSFIYCKKLRLSETFPFG